MAFKYAIFATVLIVVISYCHSLPVNTPSEERSKSEISEFVPESDKEFAVTDKSVKSEEIVIVSDNTESDGHKILKRSPRAGVIIVSKCADDAYDAGYGCVKCEEGNCKTNDADYTEMFAPEE